LASNKAPLKPRQAAETYSEGVIETRQLLRRQAALQQEANDVRASLRLDELLRTVGEPVLVGSAALGLMVWEDLDLTVICDSLDLGRVLDVGRSLAFHPDVRALIFRNDTGRWNLEPDRYPDGLFLEVRYQREGGAKWRLDLWFVDEPERQPDLRHVRTLPPRLTEHAREAILAIKTVWHVRPEYGSRVTSADIYSAVVEDGVRDVASFEEWLRRRNSDQVAPNP
jgi:hypothetical protein